jgi:hypothetical protein
MFDDIGGNWLAPVMTAPKTESPVVITGMMVSEAS